jgi:hypothetical protein
MRKPVLVAILVALFLLLPLTVTAQADAAGCTWDFIKDPDNPNPTPEVVIFPPAIDTSPTFEHIFYQPGRVGTYVDCVI